MAAKGVAEVACRRSSSLPTAQPPAHRALAILARAQAPAPAPSPASQPTTLPPTTTALGSHTSRPPPSSAAVMEDAALCETGDAAPVSLGATTETDPEIGLSKQAQQQVSPAPSWSS